MTNKDFAWFQRLDRPEIAAIVRERGPRTAVFAAGGTTRWFILNHLDGWPGDMSYWPGYLEQGGRQFLRIAQMFFDHGVRTLFTHAIVPGQLEGRDERYVSLALTSGMERLAATPEFLHFYEENGVRVRFFGNYRRELERLECEGTLARFDEVQDRTRTNDRHVLYWGFNSEKDLIAPVLELAVEFYQRHGRTPSGEEVARLYYGETVEPVDIYVGFNRTRTAGLMPPLLEGHADLYLTVGLSFDFSERQLRSILYDHLFARRGRHRDYAELPSGAFEEMRAFYRLNREGVTGVGRRYEPGAIWHPTSQVHIPPGWDEEDT